MNLMITKWLLVYVLECKHNFHFIIIFDLQCITDGITNIAGFDEKKILLEF